jgi:hypothetical protein
VLLADMDGPEAHEAAALYQWARCLLAPRAFGHWYGRYERRVSLRTLRRELDDGERDVDELAERRRRRSHG